MNALGIIFSDSYSSNERNELTKIRSAASLPVGCRFRAIDFILSNLADAGIYTVGLLTKQNYGSLIDHIGAGKAWDLDRKKAGITLLTPYALGNSAVPGMMMGKLDALRSIIPYIESKDCEYVILGQGNVVANIDFGEVLQQHTKSEADITVVFATIKNPDSKSLVVSFNDENLLTDVRFTDTKGTFDTAINCFVMRRDFLLSFLGKANLYDWHDLGRDLILRHMDCLRIVGYHHKGYTAVLSSVAEYYQCNMDMLDGNIRSELLDSERPILTHIHDTVPTLYAYHATVKNSLTADGCAIDGEVSGSILFRNVTVEQGAKVENCILMQGTHIGKDAVLKNVICDKDVSISSGLELTGSPDYPYVLVKGTKL